MDMVGGIVGGKETGTARGETWLRANPHRLDLGRIGFSLPERDNAGFSPEDVTSPHQVLDLWTGTVVSTFNLHGRKVSVATACHPDRDELGFRIESTALQHGLAISLEFPYGSEAWHNAADWTRPHAHTTTLEELPATGSARTWRIIRDLDGSGYQVDVSGSGLELEQSGQHQILLRATDGIEVLDFSVHFLSAGKGDCLPRGTGGLSGGGREDAAVPKNTAPGTAVL
ncbi:hypothetical protein, partial [Escherichia coli]|uniref:hypothetical protein n=1 Tax=Escherichia coli TaxID=562 RepID=UPI0032E402EF